MWVWLPSLQLMWSSLCLAPISKVYPLQVHVCIQEIYHWMVWRSAMHAVGHMHCMQWMYDPVTSIFITLADGKTIQIQCLPYRYQWQRLYSESQGRAVVRWWKLVTTVEPSPFQHVVLQQSTDCSYSAFSGTTTHTLLSLTVAVHTLHWTTKVFAIRAN